LRRRPPPPGAPALPQPGSRAERGRAERGPPPPPLQRRHRDLRPPPRPGRPALLLARGRRRPLLHPRGERRRAHPPWRSPLRGQGLRLHPQGLAPPLPPRSRRAAVLALDGALRRAAPAPAVEERGRAAPHGRSLLAPRLPAGGVP